MQKDLYLLLEYEIYNNRIQLQTFIYKSKQKSLTLQIVS